MYKEVPSYAVHVELQSDLNELEDCSGGWEIGLTKENAMRCIHVTLTLNMSRDMRFPTMWHLTCVDSDEPL